MQSINNSSTNIQSPLRSIARAFFPSTAAILTLLLATASSSFAGSATWKKNPASNDWQTAANWTPRTVPNGPNDTATFASSNQTTVDLAQFGEIEVNSIVFNPRGERFHDLDRDPEFDHQRRGHHEQFRDRAKLCSFWRFNNVP